GSVRQPLTGDEPDDAVVRVEPHGRDVAVAGAGADHRHRPRAHARGMTHVGPHASRPPPGEQLLGSPPPPGPAGPGGYQRLHGRELDHPPICSPDPDLVADGDLDLALTVQGLLDTLALRDLEEHALLAGQIGTLPVREVHAEVLIDDDVADLDIGEPGHEGFDGNPAVLGRGDGHAHADRGQKEREDDGAPHGCGYNALAVLNANLRSARAE